jgi:hypothetical protein
MSSNAIPEPAIAGKSNPSRNSTKPRPFAQRDFICEGEDQEYAQTYSALLTELSPGSLLEEIFATEIMGATWRLRRSRILEFDLARATEPASGSEADARQSIDRARTQSHNILRRSLTELRKLQTERNARILMIPGGVASPDLGLTDTRKAVKTAAQSLMAAEDKRAAAPGSSFCKPAPATSSFCKPPAATPRNALCPCGSGSKYKRCCGKNAPPVLNIAA